MRILLSDDDPRILKALVNMLTVRNHQVRTASNGLEALEAMTVEVPGLVLSDVQMPEMDGLAFLKASRTRYPETPVILITANYDARIVDEALRCGARDCLKKPLRVEKLLACIKAIEAERTIAP